MWHKQRSSSSKKQSCYLFGLLGSNKARENFTSDYKHPLINLIWLSAKDQQREENVKKKPRRSDRQRRNAVKSKVLCSEKEWEAVRTGFSARPCRIGQKPSWNKRGMTLLMKGRELTRIALAQCTRSFCQSRLQRYNKVHGYNEAWLHLSLNCTESLPWNVWGGFFLAS